MKVFLPMLAVLFIGLKLAGIIAWSWWLVLLPLYGGLAIVLGFLFGAALIAAAVAFLGIILDRIGKL